MTKQEALNKIDELKQYVENLDNLSVTEAVEKCGGMRVYGEPIGVSGNIITLHLPSANTEWSIAVFKWCLLFMEQNPHSTVSHRKRKITIEFRAN